MTAVRTPVGRYGGALASVRPDDLAAVVIREVVARSGIDPALVDDVYFGAANQAGEDNRNVARMAGLLAGLPVEPEGPLAQPGDLDLVGPSSTEPAVSATDAEPVTTG